MKEEALEVAAERGGRRMVEGWRLLSDEGERRMDGLFPSSLLLVCLEAERECVAVCFPVMCGCRLAA